MEFLGDCCKKTAYLLAVCLCRLRRQVFRAFGKQKEVQVTFDEITPFLQDSYAKEPEMFVALYADETVPYKEIVKILNIANENKFKMVLATRPQK